MIIGEKIKTLMEERNLHPQDLAKALDLSTSSVRKYYNKANFDTDLLNRIAFFFEVPITYFFEDHTIHNNNKATGTQSIAGNNNTITGNITLVLPPAGTVKIINSEGEVSTVEAASLEALQNSTTPEPGIKNNKNALIKNLQEQLIQLQELQIENNEP